MGVLWEVTVETIDSEIMAYMEGDTRVEIVVTGGVPCTAYLEDGARPCWAWFFHWMDMSA